MRAVAIFLTTLFLTTTALAQNMPLTTSDTGVSAGVLATTATTSPLHMEAKGTITNQLSLTFAVTPGTSTRVQVTCYESEYKTTNFAQIAKCTISGACEPWVREFTLADYTAVGGVKYIVSRWSIKKQWAKCSITDPDAGSGTVDVTGTRSWQ